MFIIVENLVEMFAAKGDWTQNNQFFKAHLFQTCTTNIAMYQIGLLIKKWCKEKNLMNPF